MPEHMLRQKSLVVWMRAVVCGLVLFGLPARFAKANESRPQFACFATAEDPSIPLMQTELHARICGGLLLLLPGAPHGVAIVAPGPRGHNSVDSFFVTHQQQRYHLKMLRLQTPDQRIKARREMQHAQTAARLGLGPAVWTDKAHTDLLLTRFVEGTNVAHANVSQQIVRASAAEALTSLHRDTEVDQISQIDGASLLANLKLFRDAILVRDNLGKGAALGITEPDTCLPHLWEWAQHLSAQLDGMTHPLALCHLDLQAGNLMWDGTRLWLLDWGEAEVSDPASDFVDFAFNQSMDLGALVQMLQHSGFEAAFVTRGIYRLAWAHVRRYFSASLGMPWDRPEDRTMKLAYLRHVIAEDMAWLQWANAAQALALTAPR